MADLRASILDDVRESQADFTPQVGDSLLVGVRLCFVVAVAGDVVTLDTDDGERMDWMLADLRGRALTRIGWRLQSARSMSPVEVAWEVAGARSLPASVRAAYVSRWVDRAKTPEDAATLRGWLAVLLRGGQPVRQ